jgi:hypothetical protein
MPCDSHRLNVLFVMCNCLAVSILVMYSERIDGALSLVVCWMSIRNLIGVTVGAYEARVVTVLGCRNENREEADRRNLRFRRKYFSRWDIFCYAPDQVVVVLAAALTAP